MHAVPTSDRLRKNHRRPPGGRNAPVVSRSSSFPACHRHHEAPTPKDSDCVEVFASSLINLNRTAWWTRTFHSITSTARESNLSQTKALALVLGISPTRERTV